MDEKKVDYNKLCDVITELTIESIFKECERHCNVNIHKLSNDSDLSPNHDLYPIKKAIDDASCKILNDTLGIGKPNRIIFSSSIAELLAKGGKTFAFLFSEHMLNNNDLRYTFIPSDIACLKGFEYWFVLYHEDPKSISYPQNIIKILGDDISLEKIYYPNIYPDMWYGSWEYYITLNLKIYEHLDYDTNRLEAIIRDNFRVINTRPQEIFFGVIFRKDM